MAFDAYLKIEGIPGESLDSQHAEWIEILQYSYDVSQAISATASSAGGATAGRIDIGDFQISKFVDRASPKLYESCCAGQHFKKVTLHINRAGGTNKVRYLEIVMEEVLISAVSGSGAASGDLPMEAVHFNFGRIKFNYIQQKRDSGSGSGNISGGWDRIGNKRYS